MFTLSSEALHSSSTQISNDRSTEPNMDPICNGSFILVAAENYVEANVAVGVPRQDAETMSDPRNKVRHDIKVDGDQIRWQFFYPTAPKYNHTYDMKLGETIELQEPIPLSITASKQDSRTFSCEMVTGSKKASYVVAFSLEGCNTQGCIDGISFTMDFARINIEVFNGKTITSDDII